MAEAAGYSGKSVIAKLGLKPGQTLLAIDAPDHYADLVAPLPDGAKLVQADWDHVYSGVDVVHAFFTHLAPYALQLNELAILPKPGGTIWVSWPKKTSPLHYDLAESNVRELMLTTGWVDVKVAAIDADWSGLKFLMRRP